MTIKLPEEKTYFALGNEPDVYLWIPVCEIRKMISAGKVDSTVLRDYPDGLELTMDESELSEYKDQYRLELGIDPQEISQAYKKAKKRVRSFKDAYVSADSLENYARLLGQGQDNLDLLKEPKYSPGEEPAKVFEGLTNGRQDGNQ